MSRYFNAHKMNEEASSFTSYDVSVAVVGSSILFAYCIWFVSIIYKSFLILKLNGIFRHELLRLIIRLNFFVSFILTANEFIQDTNILKRKCNKFIHLFRKDNTGFLDVFYLNNSFYWVVFFKYLILKLTDSTILLAATAELVSFKFSLLKKLINSIDNKPTISTEDDYDYHIFAVIFFLTCFQLDIMNTHGNQRIVMFLSLNIVTLIILIDFIRNTLTSKLLDISVSIQLKKQYGKQFKVLIIIFLFISFIFGIQYKVLARINEVSFYWSMTIINLMNVFEMMTSLIVYALLVIENLKDSEKVADDLDDKIYYIKAFANSIKFLSSIILILVAIYIQIYESMSVIRAGFIILNSYRIFLKAKEGWSTLIRRRAVNLKISNMTLINDEYSNEKRLAFFIKNGIKDRKIV